jgi:hypothetical protein
MGATRFVLVGVLALALNTGLAHAQGKGSITEANPRIEGDGTMSPAAAAAMQRGALPRVDDEVDMKNAVNAAAKAEATSRRAAPASADTGGPAPMAPTIVGGHSFAGLSGNNTGTPPDTTGAIGPNSYIQMVNRMVQIRNRSTHAVIATGTLNQLAGNASTVNSFDPQIIWDPTTNRFYYAMDSVFSSTNNKLAFGFSKTANPTTVSGTSWCHYLYTAPNASRFLDYPKLGDSSHFIIIGVNSFQPSFVGSDVLAISKPPNGNITTCPAASTFKFDDFFNIANIFTPVPANQIDNNSTGYIVARNLGLPSSTLWFLSVTRSATGFPILGAPRARAVTSYTIPPDAQQPDFTQVLDTLDARPTQAVQAFNPDRGVHSFWTQHTVKHPTENRSIIRWYEINPAPATPTLLRPVQTLGSQSGTWYFNAAISPDRRIHGSTAAFGDNAVIAYNVSSSVNNIDPRIVAGSSLSGAALTFMLVKAGISGYRDFSCPSAGQSCRWGDYSAATPDPTAPTTNTVGNVWITNQYSGVNLPTGSSAQWRTWISSIQP